jgi:hypothetical protein
LEKQAVPDGQENGKKYCSARGCASEAKFFLKAHSRIVRGLVLCEMFPRTGETLHFGGDRAKLTNPPKTYITNPYLDYEDWKQLGNLLNKACRAFRMIPACRKEQREVLEAEGKNWRTKYLHEEDHNLNDLFPRIAMRASHSNLYIIRGILL